MRVARMECGQSLGPLAASIPRAILSSRLDGGTDPLKGVMRCAGRASSVWNKDERGKARRGNETDSGEQPDLVFFPYCVGVFEVVIGAVPRVGAVSMGGWRGQQEVGRDGASVGGAWCRDRGTGHDESERGERRGHDGQNERRAATTSKIINVRRDQSRRLQGVTETKQAVLGLHNCLLLAFQLRRTSDNTKFKLRDPRSCLVVPSLKSLARAIY